ncbi:MAG: hypothetical protein ACJ79M_02155, partial [Myxococcales bacterium]
MRTRWTPDQLLRAVESSRSFREVMLRLGLRGAGGNYASIKRYVRDQAISTAHFMGQGWRRGSIAPTRPACPLQDLLREGVHVQSFKLKHRLFAAGLKAQKC